MYDASKALRCPIDDSVLQIRWEIVTPLNTTDPSNLSPEDAYYRDWFVECDFGHILLNSVGHDGTGWTDVPKLASSGYIQDAEIVDARVLRGVLMELVWYIESQDLDGLEEYVEGWI